MEKKDILHLATLARIKITDEEAESLKGSITAVLEYVSAVEDIVAEQGITKRVGALHNVFREDEITCKPGEYTDRLLGEAPSTKNGFLAVKKILNNEA